jgi:hypothetical protein
MSGPVRQARELLERTGGHPVISIYADLDPERFATAEARASQFDSLVDQARRLAEPLELDHDARAALHSDLDRVQDTLQNGELPVSGVRGLALFCSSADDLWQTIALEGPTEAQVFVEPVAHVEPLVTAPTIGRWCAVLVSSDAAEIVEGEEHRVLARIASHDYVRGAGQTGEGQSHAREQDIEGHLLAVAEELRRRLERDHFQLLTLAGPQAAVARITALLHDELVAVLADQMELDPSHASDADLVAAVAVVAASRREANRAQVLAELGERLAGDGRRAAVGVTEVEHALVERRVQTLLIGRDFTDGDNRREATIQTALLQDADVLAFDEPVRELPSTHPVAALLRF